ncbi:MAG: sulfurtransferase complex subunit TusB [Gammaproteobacteria bacterium]
MPTLHTVNKSPFENNSLESCLRFTNEGAAILLIEDGVYAALSGTKFTEAVKKAMETKAVYALQPDLEARGVANKVIDGVTLVDYAGFVDLVEQNDRVESWL